MSKPFITLLFLCNLGAALGFAWERNWPWVAIYTGAAIIQAGCLAA